MTAQQLLLTWKDHNGALVSVFENLLRKNTLVDCTLAAEGQYLKAHKLVLSACSSYFELLFRQESEKNPIVILKDVKFEELEAVVNFIYKGEVEVYEDRLQALLEVADSLQIKGLGSNGNWQDSKEKFSSVKYLSEKLVTTEKQQSKKEDLNPQSDNFDQSSNVPAGCKQFRDNECSSVLQSFETGSSPIHTVSTLSMGSSSCTVEKETCRDSDHLKNIQQSLALPSFTSDENVKSEENPIIKTESITDTFLEDQSDEAEGDTEDALTMMDDQHDFSEPVTKTMDEPVTETMDALTVMDDQHDFIEPITETMDVVLTNQQDIDCPIEHMKAEDSTCENVEGVQPSVQTSSDGYSSEHLNTEESTSVIVEDMQTSTQSSSEGYPSKYLKTAESSSEIVEDMQTSTQSSSEGYPSKYLKTEESSSEIVEDMQTSTQSCSEGAGWIELHHQQKFLSIFVNEEIGRPASWNQEPVACSISTSGNGAGPSNGTSASSARMDNLVTEDNENVVPASVQFYDAVDGNNQSSISVQPVNVSSQRTAPQELPNKCFLPSCEEVSVQMFDPKSHVRSQSCGALPNVSGSELPPDDSSLTETLKLRKTEGKFLIRGSFKCSECNYMTCYLSQLQRHLRTHKGGKPFKCPHCDNAYGRKDHLIQHLRTHTGETFKCQHCDYVSTRKDTLAVHVKRHSGEKLKCQFCDYISVNKDNLEEHLKTHMKEQLFKCTYCDFVSSMKGSLAVHLRRHTGGKKHKCIYCDYASALKVNLVMHINKHMKEKRFKCPHCDYACQLKTSWQRHLRIHTVVIFKCRYCDYTTSQKDLFSDHLTKHAGDKPYKCPHCKYATNRKCHLVQHIRIHTGEKPFKCSFCEYACATKSTMQKHERTHSGEKPIVGRSPYKCPHCDYTSRQKGHMTHHLRVHKGNIPSNIHIVTKPTQMNVSSDSNSEHTEEQHFD